jgi:hypothetical protein
LETLSFNFNFSGFSDQRLFLRFSDFLKFFFSPFRYGEIKDVYIPRPRYNDPRFFGFVRVNNLHSFRVYSHIFSTHFECSLKSSPLISDVVSHLLHSFRVYSHIFPTIFECSHIFSTRFECSFQFSTQEDADRAVRHVEGKMFEGRKLTCSIAQYKREEPKKGGGLKILHSKRVGKI